MKNESPEIETGAALKPFGIEYLEPVEFSTQTGIRGGQAEDCCVTIFTSLDSNGDLIGGAFCGDSDMCSFM